MYVEFSASQMHQWGENGTSNLRQVYERAVEEAGLHFGEADNLWGLYIAMETMVFQSVQEIQQADSGGEEQEAIREQVLRNFISRHFITFIENKKLKQELIYSQLRLNCQNLQQQNIVIT